MLYVLRDALGVELWPFLWNKTIFGPNVIDYVLVKSSIASPLDIIHRVAFVDVDAP